LLSEQNNDEDDDDVVNIRDRRIPRCSLRLPSRSPWQHIYNVGNDQAFITLLGFDKKSFDNMVQIFTPYYNTMSPHPEKNVIDPPHYIRPIPDRTIHFGMVGGRPRIVDAKTCIAIMMAYYRFKGGVFVLQGWFGLTGTNILTWLRFTIIIVINILKNIPKYAIMFPDDNTIKYYQSLVKRKHPMLKDVYCVCDGLKLEMEASGNLNIQSQYYNGWLHSHYVSNLITFGADGKIIHAVLNAPGSLHDSTLADWGRLYLKIQETYDRLGAKAVMDSAFSSRNNPGIIISSQNNNSCNDEYDMITNREATSLRQAAEWGMRAIQSAFPRVKNKIKYEEHGFRAIMLECMVLLYNYRLVNVGLNQIKTVYASFLEHEAESVFI
jgi:hypothetical protein